MNFLTVMFFGTALLLVCVSNTSQANIHVADSNIVLHRSKRDVFDFDAFKNTFSVFNNVTSILEKVVADVGNCLKETNPEQESLLKRIMSSLKGLFKATVRWFKSFFENTEFDLLEELFKSSIGNIRELFQCIKDKDPEMYKILQPFISRN